MNLPLSILLRAGDIEHGYSDEDKAELKRIAMQDREGLHTALQSDPLLPWVAFMHGLIDHTPT